MAKRKPRGARPPPAKRTKIQPWDIPEPKRSNLLDIMPLEILDTVVKMVIDDPADLDRRRYFFGRDLLPHEVCDSMTDDKVRQELASYGIAENDQFMDEILCRSIFRTCNLLRQRARQYVFYGRAWIRIAFKTPALKDKFDDKMTLFPVGKFARSHILPDDLPSFDIFVGSKSARAAANRTFETSQRLVILPFEFQTWLMICASLQKVVWHSEPGSLFKSFSVRCDQESASLTKVLSSHILPPFFAIRSLNGIAFSGRNLKSLPQFTEARMYHNKGHFDETYLEDLKLLLAYSKTLQQSKDMVAYNLFALHMDFRANHIANLWLGSKYSGFLSSSWRRVDKDCIKLRSLICKHIVQVCRVWHGLYRAKGMKALALLAKKFEVSGENRWSHMDARILFGLPRKKRGELHLAAGLAAEVSAHGILALSPDYLGMGPEAAREDAWRTLGESIEHLWNSVNLNPELTEEARHLREEIEGQRSQIGDFSDEEDMNSPDPDMNTYVELHRVAGGKFCWAGDELTIQELGGAGHLLPLKELHEAELESKDSLRCGRSCDCVMI